LLTVNYRYAQTWAYGIEDLINRTGALMDRPAASRFRAAFDKVFRHYGWQDDTSRAACQQAMSMGSVWEPVFSGPRDAVMEPPPPAINKSALSALLRAVEGFWREVVREIPNLLGPGDRKVLAKATGPQSSIKAKVIALLYENRDWTDTQIAKAAGISRGHLYRAVPDYKEIRKWIKAQGKEGRRGGVSYINSETGFHEVDAAVRDDHDEVE
jgi:hypothetical protein